MYSFVLTADWPSISNVKKVNAVATYGKKRQMDLKNHLDTSTFQREKSKQRLENIREIKRKLYDQMKTTEMYVMNETDQAISELRRMQSDLLQELREKFEIEIQKIDKTIKTLDELSKANCHNVTLLNQLMTSESDTDVILTQNQDNTKVFSTENVFDLPHDHNMIIFVSNVSAVMTTLGTLSLGRILTGKRITNTKTEGDTQTPNMRDVTVLTVNELEVIVVTDEDNKCVKCFYERNKRSCFYRLSLDGNPWSVTKLSEKKVAVSLPDQCQISIISVTPELIHQSTINTSGQYHGLVAVDNRTFAVSAGWWTGTARVDLINFSGEVIRSIATDRSDNIFCSSPYYLCATPNNDIIVSNCDKKDVTCVTQTGQVKFRYQQILHHPRGVSCDNSGSIFAADVKLDKVVKMTEDGNLVQDFMTSQDGLISPQGVCFYDKCLYIVHSRGEITVMRLN